MEKQIECVRYCIQRGDHVMWGLTTWPPGMLLWTLLQVLEIRQSFVSMTVGSRNKDDGMIGVGTEVCQNQPKAAHRTNG